MPYSLNKALVEKRIGISKNDAILKDSRIAIYPPSLDLKNIVATELDKSISFLPYCAKPIECPVSSEHGRKNKECIKLMGGRCDVPCSVGKMIDVLKKHGFTKDRIFIIDRDSNLFPWLIMKKEEGYKYLIPAVACYYGVGYALEIIRKKLGYEGCIVLLDDYDPTDKDHGLCRKLSDHFNMDKVDKGNRTKIVDESIELMEKILDGKYP